MVEYELLETFFGCFNLSSGGVIVGLWNMIYSSIKIIIASHVLINKENQFLYLKGINVACPIGIGISLISLLSSIALVCGARKGLPKLLLQWLILDGLLSIITSLAIMVVAILFFTHLMTIGLVLIFIDFALTDLNAYFWLCVLSLYLKLKEERLRLQYINAENPLEVEYHL